MKVEIPLHRRQVDDAEGTDVIGIVDLLLRHHFRRPLRDPADAGVADEHVVRLFGQHEAAGPGERIEAGFRQRRELVLAVAIGEEGEHEERQPVRRRLVEGAEDARIVAVARAPLEQRFGLLAAVAAEVAMQQVDHRPQMTPLFDIHLIDVAQVVE